ncbi:MAG: AbrB/MazE/SpoVT family DNA-binding domain-containing protein [Ignavibacterium sp.]
MKIVKVTSNRRITLPAELRTKYGLYAGRKVKFEMFVDGFKIIPLVTKEEIKTNIGFLGTKGRLLNLLLEKKNSLYRRTFFFTL